MEYPDKITMVLRKFSIAYLRLLPEIINEKKKMKTAEFQCSFAKNFALTPWSYQPGPGPTLLTFLGKLLTPLFWSQRCCDRSNFDLVWYDLAFIDSRFKPIEFFSGGIKKFRKVIFTTIIASHLPERHSYLQIHRIHDNISKKSGCWSERNGVMMKGKGVWVRGMFF